MGGLCEDRGALWGLGGLYKDKGALKGPLSPSQGRTHQDMVNPDPPELLRLIFSALSFVSATPNV